MTGSTDIICLANWHGVGGAQLNAGMLTAAFRERGYKAQLGFLFEREPHSRHGVDDYFVCAPRAPRSRSEWSLFAAEAKQRLVAQRPRAIFGFQPLANVFGALAAARVTGCQMVATQRNPANRQSAIVGLAEGIIGATPLYHANIAVSQDVALSYRRHLPSYRRKLTVVHNATPPLPQVEGDSQSFRRALKMDKAGVILGCLARLHPQKNVGFALKVLQHIPEAHLYLAGDGPEEQALRREAAALGVSDQVHFLGALSGDDITRFLRAVDVLLFTSIYEGFGRVLVEAMSQGAPVVSSDLPVAREVAGSAAIYQPFDSKAWADAITSLLTDAHLRTRMIAAGKARAAQFTIETMVTGYLRSVGLNASGAEHP